MTEIERIQDQMKRAYDGDPWPGPSLKKALDGVTAGMASRRTVAEAHTIWEVVLHVAAWKEVARLRLEWKPVTEPEEGDFPQVTETNAEAWARALELLETNHRKLLEVVTDAGDEWQFDKLVPVGGKSVYETLHGILQHDIYHAGQIMLLRKGSA
jgi:uncharacterized damage-inducible protein DinB